MINNIHFASRGNHVCLIYNGIKINVTKCLYFKGTNSLTHVKFT